MDKIEKGLKDREPQAQDFHRCKCGYGSFYNANTRPDYRKCPYCGHETKVK